MDALPLHPSLVHLPIALGVLMPPIAAGVLLAWWRGWLPARAWILVIALQALLVVSGVLALRSGEADEERVEQVVPEAALEAHEEAAELFIWGSGAVLAIAVIAGWLRARRAGMPMAAVALVGTLAVLGLGYRTGRAGGSLVYVHGAAQIQVGAASSPTPSQELDND